VSLLRPHGGPSGTGPRQAGRRRRSRGAGSGRAVHSGAKTSTATTGVDTVFFDTSLIVAASVKEHPGYAAARAYIAAEVAKGSLWMVTPQIFREFMAVLTRAPVSGRLFTPRDAVVALKEWRDACNLLEEGEATVAECLALIDRHQVHGKQVHDCNVVAAMNVHGVRRLATRNPSDFARYPGITVDAITP
jgi:predicted nucleic acid-binding protein